VISKRLLGIVLGFGLTLSAWASAQASEYDSHFGEVYTERESGPLKADLYVPRGEGPHPGVLVVHGGAWHMGTRAQLSGVAQTLAQNGFTAVAISYRLAPAHKFPAQIEDCQEAVRWMRNNAERLKIDPERIAGFGYSAGAQLVALLGTTGVPVALEGVDETGPVRLQAVVGGGAPCDFRQFPLEAQWLSFWLGGPRSQFHEQYLNASPAAFVSADSPPMFFFHGETDNLVPVDSPQAMCRQLQAAGVPAELYIVPHVGHVFAMLDQGAITKSIEFLGKQLQHGPDHD